jgi:hypothetical protein
VSGGLHQTQHEVFLHQATQADGRSPLYARLLRELADDPRVGEIIESPPRWDAGLRLLGGLHQLVLTGRASWDRVGDALVDERDFLRRFVAEQRVQTNEVQRCWALLPCFLEAARRLEASTVDLIELGTSAGLLLFWDRYRYLYEAGEWGPEDAPLELSAEERGRVPAELLRRNLAVRERIGLDLEPVDVTEEEGALLLRSFVWADRTERIERLDRAIGALRSDPPRIVRGDFVELLPGLLEERRPDALTIVLQIAAAGNLDEEGWERLHSGLEEGGRRGPLAYVFAGRPEPSSHQYWGLWLTTWPGGERTQLALADFHGAWLDWLS